MYNIHTYIHTGVGHCILACSIFGRTCDKAVRALFNVLWIVDSGEAYTWHNVFNGTVLFKYWSASATAARESKRDGLPPFPARCRNKKGWAAAWMMLNVCQSKPNYPHTYMHTYIRVYSPVTCISPLSSFDLSSFSHAECCCRGRETRLRRWRRRYRARTQRTKANTATEAFMNAQNQHVKAAHTLFSNAVLFWGGGKNVHLTGARIQASGTGGWFYCGFESRPLL